MFLQKEDVGEYLRQHTNKNYLKGESILGKKNDGVPNIIRYLSEVEGFAPWTWWPHEDVGHTDEAKKENQFNIWL